MTTGFFTFPHHNHPVEWTWDLEERLHVIDTEKPEHERAIRKACIVRVSDDRLPPAFALAARVYSGAMRWVYVAEEREHYHALRALVRELVPAAPWDEERRHLIFPSAP